MDEEKADAVEEPAISTEVDDEVASQSFEELAADDEAPPVEPAASIYDSISRIDSDVVILKRSPSTPRLNKRVSSVQPLVNAFG